MTVTPFNDGWNFQREPDAAPVPVVLPHDAMIGEERSRTAPSGSHGAYFPGGRYVYSKSWTPPRDLVGREVSLFFEGVYGTATIRVNGDEVGGSTSGYREFEVPLDVVDQTPLLIEVEVDNTRLPNSRWYTGSGIYRRVWLEDVASTHIPRDGVRLTTTRAGTSAIVSIAVEANGLLDKDARVAVALAVTRRPTLRGDGTCG